MADKDIVEKTLEVHNDVFCDIMNVLLFDGKRVVREEELQDALARSHYKADDGKLHEMERDTAKYWMDSQIRIAFIGYENQTEPDGDAPLRGMGYDGAEYRKQMLWDVETVVDSGTGKQKKRKCRKPRYPVVTLFLYFNYQKRWNKPRTLHECLEIPPGLKEYVNDYRINLFEIAYLSEEQAAMFQSDFRIVADYFIQMRKNKKYVPSEITIRHVHEILELMAVMTGDDQFLECAGNLGERKEKMTMGDVFGPLIAEGEARGLANGLVQGKKEGMDRMASFADILLSAGRVEDLKYALKNEEYCEKLMKEVLGDSNKTY